MYLLLDLAIKIFHLPLKTHLLLICSSPTAACFVDFDVNTMSGWSEGDELYPWILELLVPWG